MSTFTSLLISRSYWFDKSQFVIEGKLLLATSTPSLGVPPNSSSVAITRLAVYAGRQDGEDLENGGARFWNWKGERPYVLHRHLGFAQPVYVV